MPRMGFRRQRLLKRLIPEKSIGAEEPEKAELNAVGKPGEPEEQRKHLF